MTDLTDPIFNDEDAARKHFEAIRWPNGPVCPKCGVIDQATLVKGKSHRKGMYQCNACREPFTVTVGSVMESSHVPLHKWALGFHLMASSKKGISAHQLMRNLGLGSYRTAWFMAHRIREAMRDTDPSPMGGEGSTVELDETFIGRKAGRAKAKGWGHKNAVLSLVDRNSGRVRSFHVEEMSKFELVGIARANIARETRMMTDEAKTYTYLSDHFASHETVNHKNNEWVRGDAYTNTVEGYFSIFSAG